MTANVFVDSNVLVYSRDAAEPAKQAQAHAWLAELWQRRQGAVSFQVLQEFYVTVTRKLDPGMPTADARADVRALLAWNPVRTDPPLLEAACQIEDRHKLPWWDSLIVAAAHRAGTRYLLTEDFQTGADFGGVTVINPFHTAFAELT